MTTQPERRASTGDDPGIEFTGLIQSMLNAISQPVSVKPGGYCEDIFLDLSTDEKEKFECSICFLITKDPRECPNRHLFCSTCIFTWSMSLSSETRFKCPVCRTDGRYRPNNDIDNALARKHVKCPEKDCSWAGKLFDYRWHTRRHENNERRSLPPMMRARSVHTMNANHLADGFHAFEGRLQSRRRNIQQHLEIQENSRRESLEEVESLSRRLGTVAHNIVHLLDNMQHDSHRFQQYVTESQHLLPSITASPSPSPRTHTPRSSPRSEARIQRIMSETTPPSNPFVVSDNLPILRPAPRTPLVPLDARYTPTAADERVRRLLMEPTPTTNPFTLPEDLPVLRPPPRIRNGLIRGQHTTLPTGNDCLQTSPRPRSVVRRPVLRRNAERAADTVDASCESPTSPRW